MAIFGLAPEGDLGDLGRAGRSGLNIPAAAKPLAYPVSQLRDKVRTLACSGSVDHTVIAKLADEGTAAALTPAKESCKPSHQVLQQSRADVKALVET